MIKIKCYYYDKEIDYRCCSFLDEHDNELICFNKIFGAVLGAVDIQFFTVSYRYDQIYPIRCPVGSHRTALSG